MNNWRLKWLALVVGVTLLKVVSAADFEMDGHVYVLNKDNFDEFVKGDELKMVEFYAPWCGHCKKLAPEYEKAAHVLSIDKPPVKLGKVDATVETELASKYEVNGYPTLKWWRDSVIYDYDGGRQDWEIVEYIRKRADPEWKPPPPAVVDLTQDNFTSFIQQDLVLVEFYAPWCGHCKKLAPEYEKAAKKLLENDPPIPLAKVDATAETGLASQYGVSGYPTLKMFRKSKVYEYKGGRDEHTIVDYMKKQAGDASQLMESFKLAKKEFNEQDVTIIGLFNTDQDDLYEKYMEAANNLREDYTFMHLIVSNPEELSTIEKKLQVKSIPAVVVYLPDRYQSKFEPVSQSLNEAEDAAAIESFIAANNVALVGEYSQKRYDDKSPLCLMFFTVDWSFDHRQATQLWRSKLVSVAKDYREPRVYFAIADDENQSSMLRDFNLDDDGSELRFACYGQGKRKFPMEEGMDSFDDEEIRQFVDNFLAGRVKPYLKSQPIPKRADSGPVKTLVALNFASVVFDEDRDVLVEFYAPWCGHCKKFEPEYKKLAAELAKEQPNLILAKYDATANDAPPGYEVSGFPTLYYAPAHSIKTLPIKYEGNRDLDDLRKFLEKHAGASFGASATGPPKEEL